jgi:hypothetical protein
MLQRTKRAVPMVKRGDILMLGITSGVIGGLTAGLLLGVGLNLVVNGAHVGWILVLPAAPVSGLFGWLLARRLAKELT